MGMILMPGGGGGIDLDVITAAAGDILSGKVIVGPDGEPLTGTLALTGDATAGNVLTGKTFYSNNPKSKLTGTMPNRGNLNWSGNNTTASVAAGYYTGGTLDSRPSYNSGRTQGRNDVTGSPGSYGLYTKSQYDNNYNSGYNNGKSAAYPANWAWIAASGDRAELSFRSDGAGYWVGCMAGDPGHYENFSISGASELVCNLSWGNDTPPSGSKFCRMIIFKTNGAQDVIVNWGGVNYGALIAKISNV